MPKKKIEKDEKSKKIKNHIDDSISSTENNQKGAPISGVRRWMEKTNSDRKYSGRVQVSLASAVHAPYMLRRPTGILGLDIALGGGFHAGGEAEIKGVESSGKTLLAFQTAGMCQRIYGDQASILIGCTEILPDKGLARQAGFCIAYSDEEIEGYASLREESGEPPFTEEEIADLKFEIGTVGISVAANGEMLLQTLIDALEFSKDDKNQGWQIMIIESLGALLSSDAEEKEIGENIRIGGVAGMLTAWQNKVYPNYIFPRSDGRMQETTIIGINQARANFDSGLYGPKTRAAASAHSFKHGMLVSLELSRGADIKDDKIVLGKEVRWKIAKGKAGTHDGLSGQYNFYHFDRRDPVFWNDVVNAPTINGIDTVTEAIEAAKKHEILEMSGAWVRWYDGNKQILQAQGVDKFANALMDKPELLEELKTQTLKASGVKVKYK
jgi:recombination protein RecA